jgi:hypothetical protein
VLQPGTGRGCITDLLFRKVDLLHPKLPTHHQIPKLLQALKLIVKVPVKTPAAQLTAEAAAPLPPQAATAASNGSATGILCMCWKASIQADLML